MSKNKTNLILLLATLLGVLFFIEIGIRLIAPQNLMPVLTQRDTDLTYTLRPNINGRHVSHEAGFDISVKTNNRGLRDKNFPYSKPWNTIRILGLGDSFTFGWGVNSEETYLKVLEERLNSFEIKSKFYFETINAGVAGYGTSQELRYLKRELHQYKPEWVVVCFNKDDINDNLVFNSYALKDDKLIENTPKATTREKISKFIQMLPFYSFFAEESHLVAFFRNRLAILLQNQEYKEVKEDKKDINDIGFEDDGNYALKLQSALFAEMMNFTQSINAKLLVIGFVKGDDPYLKRMAQKHGFDYIFMENLADNSNPETYLPVDGHWSVQGHNEAANYLFDFFREKYHQPGNSNKDEIEKLIKSIE